MLSFWLCHSGWGWEPISRQLCGLKQSHIINYNGYKHTIKGHMRRHTVQKVHRAQSTCISVSSIFRTIDPPPPPHPTLAGRWGGGDWGVNISEDARHWIGFLQYNPSTLYSDKDSKNEVTNRSPHPDVVFATKFPRLPFGKWKLRVIFPSSRSFFSLWFG